MHVELDFCSTRSKGTKKVEVLVMSDETTFTDLEHCSGSFSVPRFLASCRKRML